MALNFQTVDVRFDKGLDTHTQQKLVIPGKWNQLENCTLSDDRTPQRRDGIAAIIPGANGNGLATYNQELLLVNGQTLSSLTTAQTDAMVSKSGALGYVGVSKDEVYRSTALVDSMDTAYGNGFSCHVWRESVQPAVPTGIKYTLIDETTGVKVFSEVLLSATATVMCPRVVWSSDAFFVFWIDAAPALQCVVIRAGTGATPTQGTRVALISSASLGQKNFDACSCDTYALGAPLAMVVYPWNDGTTSVRSLGVTHVAGVPAISLGPTNIIPEATVTYANLVGMCCAIFYHGSGTANRAGIFTLSTQAGQQVLGTTINTAWAITAGPTVQSTSTTYAGSSHITAVADNATSLFVYFDQRARQGVVGFLPVEAFSVNNAQTQTTLNFTLISSSSFDQNAARASGPMGPWIGGKAFRNGSSLYLPVYIQSDWGNPTLGALGANCVNNNQQCSFFLLDATTGVVVAKALYGALGPDGQMSPGSTIPAVSTSTPCSVATLSTGVFSIVVPERTRLQYANAEASALLNFATTTAQVGTFNVSQAGVVRLELTPNTATAPISAQLGESTYLSGGSVSNYDGSAVREHGFPLFPEGISVVAVGGGGSMTVGTRQVLAIYEWVDGSGNLHQSAPSLAVQVSTVANDSLSVIIPTLLLSQKTGIRLVVFMTLANGDKFYRVTPVFTPSLNVTTASTVTYTVTASDASIEIAELLYTQPDIRGTTLPNLAPGPNSWMALHQNRIFMDTADNPGGFVYSQKLIQNVGLQFNPTLGGRVDVNAGRTVGAATMDEKLIIFCERRPYVMYGSGPDGAGGFSGYGEPQEVSSDVGCSDARSILKMPNGIIFKSSKGWYLLGRDLVARYIGEGVAAYDANSVSGAVLLEDRQECRFSSASGTQLIYSYDVDGGEWSTTVYRLDTGAAVTSYLVASAAWWATSGRYVTVSTTQGLSNDTPGVYIDAPGSAAQNLSIITTARTAWLKMSTINGFQRVRRLFLTGTSPNAPTSTLTLTAQFNDAYGASVDPGAYSVSVVYSTVFPAFTVGTSVDFVHHLRQQKCKSVAFTFVDTPTTANPSGVNFQALSLELGLKRGLRKLPAAQNA